MHNFTRMLLRRWTVPAAAVTGLLFIPACGLSSAVRQQPDHVFSTGSPRDLEHGIEAGGAPVRANYEQLDGTATSEAVHATFDQQHAAVPSPAAPSPAGVLSSVTDGVYRTASMKRPRGSSAPSALQTGSASSEPRSYTRQDGTPDNAMESVAPAPLADQFADEYVFDGGHHGIPKRGAPEGGLGLQTEDAVAEFADHTGARRMKPSNRVAIYSPRFGSVRSVSGLEVDVKVDAALATRDALAVGNLRTGQSASESVLGTGVVGLGARNRVDGMQTALPPSQSSKTDQLAESRKADQIVEGRRYMNVEEFERADAASLQTMLQNALVWTREEFPQIVGSSAAAGDLKAVFKVQQTVGLEDERRTVGDLQIVKLADRSVAQSGDTVTFTLRFRNLGDFDIHDVKIVDNLTPRLQYVANSAVITASNPGEITVDVPEEGRTVRNRGQESQQLTGDVNVVPNGEGSQVLTFTLDQPLRGHGSGVITFDARVR